MDIAEQVPLQIHTPPKEDEDDVPEVIDNPPVVADETPVITSESYDTAEAEAFEAHEPEELEDQMEEGEEVFEEEPSGDIVMEAEQSREDEIVVEPDDGEHERNGQNGIASPLSSPPESEIASPASKTEVRVEIPAPKSRKGIKLGEIEGVKARLDKRLGSDELLKAFHRLLYRRAGTAHEVKKNIREFPGFSDDTPKSAIRDKISKLMNAQIKDISALLGLHVSGTKNDLVETLVNFLYKPYDTKKSATKTRRRSSGKVSKTVSKKKSNEKVAAPKVIVGIDAAKVQKRSRRLSKQELDGDEDDENDEEEEEEEKEKPARKKAKTTATTAKPKPKPKPKPKAESLSKPTIDEDDEIESSDDDLPLRPAPTDSQIKESIFSFLKDKDLTTITKGMVKEHLRGKYGESVVKNKRDVITSGIVEGMETM